jgi:hypothetical protein
MTDGEATPSPSKSSAVCRRFRRGRGCERGVYFKGYVYDFVLGFAERVGCSFSHAVNFLLEKALSEGIGNVEDKLRLEVRREQLLAEERSLCQRLRVILRSGAYLKDYAKKLLLGDSEQITNLKRRVGVYSHVKPEELNIILRILKRREDLVNELLEVEDRLLPSARYPFMVTEHGWKIGDSIYACDKLRRLSQAKTGSSPKPTRKRRDPNHERTKPAGRL